MSNADLAWYAVVAGFALVLIRELRRDGRQSLAVLCTVVLVLALNTQARQAMHWLDTDGQRLATQGWEAVMRAASS